MTNYPSLCFVTSKKELIGMVEYVKNEITLHINLIWMLRWVCELGCMKMDIEHWNLKDAKENWLDLKECYVRNT